jgi:hypothetical protein
MFFACRVAFLSFKLKQPRPLTKIELNRRSRSVQVLEWVIAMDLFGCVMVEQEQNLWASCGIPDLKKVLNHE